MSREIIDNCKSCGFKGMETCKKCDGLNNFLHLMQADDDCQHSLASAQGDIYCVKCGGWNHI